MNESIAFIMLPSAFLFFFLALTNPHTSSSLFASQWAWQNLPHVKPVSQSFECGCIACSIMLYKDPSISLLAAINRRATVWFVFLEWWLHLLVLIFTLLSPCDATATNEPIMSEDQRLMPHVSQQTVNDKYSSCAIINVLTGSKGFAFSPKRFPTNLLQRSKVHLCDVLSTSTQQQKP